LGFEGEAEHGRELRLVVDDQDPLLHGRDLVR
jgi:hypothetical protein